MAGRRFMLLLLSIAFLGSAVSVATLSLDGTCSTDVGANRFSIAPDVNLTEPYTYCLRIQVNNSCGASGSTCCKNSTTVTFLLDVEEDCLYETIAATLNGKSLAGLAIEPAAGGFGTRAVLSIPGLKLDAKALGTKGAQLCIKLPKASICGSVDRLIPRGIPKWNATLLSADSKCCPTTSLRPPPPVKCETCWVWDVIPSRTPKPAGTPSWDFLSRKSCELGSLEPQYDRGWKNCCEYEGYWHSLNTFSQLRELGLVTGFDKPVCTATTLRLCGTFASQAVGQGLAAEQSSEGSLRFEFDNTDDTCPMGLFGRTVRRRSLLPGTGSLDTRCAPTNEEVKDMCWEPTGPADDLQEGLAPFPNSTCNATPGVTPFTIDKYIEVNYFNTTNVYCVNIGTMTPKPAKSACASATTLDRASFWIIDDEYRRQLYRGAYLLTKEGAGGYKRTDLNASWGNQDEQVYNVYSLGLDVATVKAKQPKLCIVRDNEGQLWYDTVSGMGYLWTALYDKSGKCCPVNYANRF